MNQRASVKIFFGGTEQDIAVRDSKTFLGQYEECRREEMYESTLTEAEWVVITQYRRN